MLAAVRSWRLGTTGLVALSILSIPGIASAAPPSNDNFGSRVTASSLPFSDTRITTEATTEAGEPQPNCVFSIVRTVWYEFTPSSSMILRADTIGSNFDTVVAAWTGTTFSGLTPVGCDNEGGPGSQSDLVFQATAGTTYLFQVGGDRGASGNLTFHLSTGGGISGTVTAEGGGPLQGICVDVYDAASGEVVRFAETDASGQYTVLVGAGSFKVEFLDFCDAENDRLSEWYNDKLSEAAADPVSVGAGTITGGINAALAAGGSISGTVTAEGGGVLEDICVELFDDASGDFVDFTLTDPSGQYSFLGLRTGSYKVRFYDECDVALEHAYEWYNDKGSQAAADPVSVTQGSATTNIDAALAPGGSISGRVAAEGGGPLPGICVIAYDASSGEFAGFDETNSSGSYSVLGLRTGSHKILFRDTCDSAADRAYEWYDDKASRAVADPVSVTAGNETPDIDAALALGGSISGTVTAQESGLPLSGICVEVSDAAGDVVSSAFTSGGGEYSAGGLRSGSYKVFYYDECDSSFDDRLREWYNDKASEATADPVAVTQGSITPDIDAALALRTTLRVNKAGTGSGTVTSAPGGIDCGADCSQDYGSGTSVTLTAAAAAGSVFAGWSGACSGTGICQITMDGTETVTATFNPAPLVMPPGTAQPKSVTLKAKPRRVQQGRRTRLTAVVSPCAGHEGDLVEFYRGAKRIGSRATDGSCTAKLRVKMRRTATFAAVSPQQDTDHTAGTSNAARVRVIRL